MRIVYFLLNNFFYVFQITVLACFYIDSIKTFFSEKKFFSNVFRYKNNFIVKIKYLNVKYSTNDDLKRSRPRSLEVIIGGIFDVQILDFNDKVVFIPEDIGKKLFLRKKGFDGIDIKTGEHSNLKNIKKVIQQKINNSHIETWSEIHENLFSAMRLERVGSMIVLSLIVLVGCFNLTTTLMLITIQKIKHFGILTALGASKINIRTIIFKQGFYTGLIGILSGLVLGLSAILIQNIFGIIKLPSDIYFTSNLPMIVRTIDILSILFITLLMIFISSSIASRRIDSLKVIKAIVSHK